MTYINLSNDESGRNYNAGEASEALQELYERFCWSEWEDATPEERRNAMEHAWDEITNWMDDEIMEALHMEYAPCSNEEFLAAYLLTAKNPLIIP